MPDETPDPGLSAFARALAAAAPHPGRLDRDALLFAAGRAAQARRQQRWVLATAALALLSAGLGSTLVLRPAVVVEVERVVYAPAPAFRAPAAPEPPSAPPAGQSPSPAPTPLADNWTEGLRLRERVFRDGIAALPPVSLAWYGPPPRAMSERDVPELSALPHAPLPSTFGDPLR